MFWRSKIVIKIGDDF